MVFMKSVGNYFPCPHLNSLFVFWMIFCLVSRGLKISPDILMFTKIVCHSRW